jgi:hypothetical protein
LLFTSILDGGEAVLHIIYSTGHDQLVVCVKSFRECGAVGYGIDASHPFSLT